jgi:hypothetical protein
MQDKQSDTPRDLLILGALFALVLMLGTPVLQSDFGVGNQAATITAVPVAPEHG